MKEFWRTVNRRTKIKHKKKKQEIGRDKKRREVTGWSVSERVKKRVAGKWDWKAESRPLQLRFRVSKISTPTEISNNKKMKCFLTFKKFFFFFKFSWKRFKECLCSEAVLKFLYVSNWIPPYNIILYYLNLKF